MQHNRAKPEVCAVGLRVKSADATEVQENTDFFYNYSFDQGWISQGLLPKHYIINYDQFSTVKF